MLHRKTLRSRWQITIYLLFLVHSSWVDITNCPQKIYWEGKSDVAVKLIADNFRRNGFDSTMRILHSANNLEMSDDRIHKVRPLFDIQNAAFKRRKVTPRVNVDEQILWTLRRKAIHQRKTYSAWFQKLGNLFWWWISIPSGALLRKIHRKSWFWTRLWT